MNRNDVKQGLVTIAFFAVLVLLALLPLRMQDVTPLAAAAVAVAPPLIVFALSVFGIVGPERELTAVVRDFLKASSATGRRTAISFGLFAGLAASVLILGYRSVYANRVNCGPGASQVLWRTVLNDPANRDCPPGKVVDLSVWQPRPFEWHRDRVECTFAAAVPTDAGLPSQQAHFIPNSTEPVKGEFVCTTDAGAPDLQPNDWVVIKGAPRDLYLGVDEESSLDVGFKPSRRIAAPTSEYRLQRHEVTWAELSPWLQRNPSYHFVQPDWIAALDQPSGAMPATGVPWKTAHAYCEALDGRLPTEEEWEYALRGSARAAYPTFPAVPPSPSEVHVLTSAAIPVRVMKNKQDVTETQLYDLLGNARDWTSSFYRHDSGGTDESWVTAGGNVYRTVRGLPLQRNEKIMRMPTNPATYRSAMCAEGPCGPANEAALQDVGFRCACDGGKACKALAPVVP